MRIRNGKKGYTLPELAVTMAVLGVILAMSIPTAVYYIRRAEFRKNEENAKTIYMAAESALTWYRSSGQWEGFKEKILDRGTKNPSFDDEKKDRIYAVVLAPGAYNTDEGQSSPVLDIMDDLTYSRDMLSSGAVALEIDVESGHVYSAFYGTRCRGLDYSTGDAGKILDMDDRSYESRTRRLLGYYSAEDITNVVELDPVRLKVSSISLVNSETLHLNWSSNSRHDNLDLEFYITFYEKDSHKELFQLTVNSAKEKESGWSVSAADAGSITGLPMKIRGAAGEETEVGGWNFPLTYQDGIFSLVLDGMMSADALAALQSAGLTEDERAALHKSSDMSITRLARISEIKAISDVDLSEPQNIYATVKAVSTYQNIEGDTSEYRQSSAVTSNTANTMYADGTGMSGDSLQAGISGFRHLSNIRYYGQACAAEFTLAGREMDWNSAGTGLYGYAESDGVKKLKWEENDGKLEFPTISRLAENHSLSGGLNHRKISNLRLGTDSVIEDITADRYGIRKTEYVGLFCEAAGRISNIIFQNPSVLIAEESGDLSADAVGFGSIRGVGIVAGRNTGDLTELEITADSSKRQILTVSLADRTDPEKTVGVGGIVGVLECEGDARISGLSVSGAVTAKLPAPGAAGTGQTEAEANQYRYGVGGLIGYADLQAGAKITQCVNHADVSGNLFTGGIVGNMDGSFDADQYNAADDLQGMSNLMECENDGLILCTASHGDEENKIEGRYFGGIVGYASRVLVYESSSASGRASKFSYSEADKDLLKGQYVGGIMGFGTDCLLLACDTQKKGYILGSDYVGGIVGGLTQKEESFSRIGGGIGVTANAGYVIGNRYVGGILGKNDGRNKIENCVNNGVAAGYTAYIGGIVGYNGREAVISNCVSYISDHNGEIFKQIVEGWNAAGSYAGGIVGYNNGTIEFKDGNDMITVRSVSNIVVGRDYVGGVVGFNDTAGYLDVDNILIGGRIYAYGDCAGGYIGLNASTKILEDEIEIRPSSVQGVYCVGGCIGANVVALEKDTVMDGFRTNNALGKLTAKAFAGGVIGYQRTYTAGKPGELLPQLDSENLPTRVTESDNPYRLILADRRNSEDSLEYFVNNLEIGAQMYVGGVLGYCENGSRLTVRNCKNTGTLLKLAGTEPADSADGVKVARYLTYSGCLAEGVDEKIVTDMAGGITGGNLTNQIIDHCANAGNITGFTCLGGVAGFNGGGIFNCELTGNFGNASQDYIGGIAGLNVKTSDQLPDYTDVNGKQWENYVPGTIAMCGVHEGVTVTGRNTVGGIAAYNLPDGVIEDSVCAGNVTAYGDYAGGLVGRNAGRVLAGEDDTAGKRTVSGQRGQGIGGLVGRNEASGSVRVSGTGEVTAANSGLTVVGGLNVGGLIGENDGSLGTAGGSGTGKDMLVCRADQVRALGGNAGGIAGISSENIMNVKNASGQVTADTGSAGGIVASNPAGGTIASCVNTGNVNSNYGYAGGIAAENSGTISGCSVSGTSAGTISVPITVRSRGAAQAGAVCAVNYAGAVIEKSAPGKGVTLDGSGTAYGAVTGLNQGTVKNTTLTEMPGINVSGVTGLSVGGAAGVNENRIEGITAEESFKGFSNYRYLGGIAGENRKEAVITGSSYGGRMKESAGAAAGSCYGGIAGINFGTVESCAAGKLAMQIRGVYAATGTSTAAQKEAMASHAGGIVGKNEEGAAISDSYLDAAGGSILVENGMAGGVAGYNKGTMSRCGDLRIVEEISRYDGSESIDTLCSGLGITAQNEFVKWADGKEIEDLTYQGGNSVSGNRLRLIVSTKGSLGGITAYNAPTGQLEYCAAGDWFLNNKSEDISVGTGGVIGMNESEKDMKYLVNQAFVGRQLKAEDTNRFAGGIIGNQSNSTTEGWTLSRCVNYGTIYGYHSHYCGGVIGQWIGSGGNIEECRNYGSLQTTYIAGWVGASAGIVAQLYHAYEENTYNIISCGNFGSIYGRDGKSTDSAANDSAGILGNVTAYLKSADQAQNFTIQVLDCVNGPGVEIYSGSMASGIVGFFSADSPNAVNITAATGNIKLRIERCRNFASKLQGKTFAAGIFGDRYGETGAKNTVIRDCYSVNDKTRRDYPIVSFSSGSNSVPASVSGADNYFFDDLNWASSYQTSFSPEEGKENAAQSSGTIWRYEYQNGDWSKLGLADGDRAYLIFNQTQKKYAAIRLTEEGKKSGDIRGKGCYINPEDWGIYNKNDVKIAKILFVLPEGATEYKATSELVSSGSVFYTYVRDGWRVQEGAAETEDGKRKLTAPARVTAEIKDGRIQLEITPAANPDPRAEAGSACDPFKYEAEVSIGGIPVSTEYLYAETGSIPIPASAGGAVEVKVRAISMYPDTEPSEEKASGEIKEKILLPAPDIRAELVWDSSLQNYRYELSLENLEDYNDLAEDNWKVTAEVSGQKLTLSKDNPTARVAGNANLQQIVAQAEPTAATPEGITYIESAQVSVQAYLPDYLPDTPLESWNAWNPNEPAAAPVVKVEGSTLKTLSVTVSLTHSGKTPDTPPIYRAELIGTWKAGTSEEKRNVVFASEDIQVAALGEASVSFMNLPEHISGASDLKVRVWYAEPGLGPVYTYHQADTEAEGNHVRLTGLSDEGEPVYEYLYSEALEAKNNDYFGKYRYVSDGILTWLPAPKLAGVTDESGGVLMPEYDDEGRLQYVFYWDAGDAFHADARYEVSLMGIDENGNTLLVDTSSCRPERGTYEGKDAWALTVPAEDWNFTEVSFSVTRVGDEAERKIGLTSDASYGVRRRLPKPEQPVMNIVSLDELDYTVIWQAITPETGCASYQLYAQVYSGENGSYGTPFPLGSEVAAGGGTEYSQTVNLEEYAGEKLRFYLKAQAAVDSAEYVDSTAGITCDLIVPERIPAPKADWTVSWEYDRGKPLSLEDFQAGDSQNGLTVKLTADAASIPPGGSAYLMRAYIYESEDAAKVAAREAEEARSFELAGYLAGYPQTEDGIRPAEMERAGSDRDYRHTMQGIAGDYAGKWVVFQVRISSGSGSLSSRWVTSGEPQRFPYVRLDPVQVQSERIWNSIMAEVSENPDIDPAEHEWGAEQTAFYWDSGAYADVCYVDITEKASEGGTMHSYRIQETKADGNPTVKVSWKNADGEWEDAAESEPFTYRLEDYRKTKEGSYSNDGVTSYYRVSTYACLQAELQGDGTFRYTLLLPDTASVKDAEGYPLPDSEWKYSSKAVFRMDVLENESEVQSPAYVGSEENTVEWN